MSSFEGYHDPNSYFAIVFFIYGSLIVALLSFFPLQSLKKCCYRKTRYVDLCAVRFPYQVADTHPLQTGRYEVASTLR